MTTSTPDTSTDLFPVIGYAGRFGRLTCVPCAGPSLAGSVERTPITLAHLDVGDEECACCGNPLHVEPEA